MKSKQFIKKWLIPQGLAETYSRLKFEKIGLKKGLIKQGYIDILRKNVELNRIYNNKRCFIIGNGPSTNSQDLKLLKDEFTFVVNSFFRFKDYEAVHPKFYCLIDPAYFEGSETFVKYFIEIEKKVHLDTVFFFPIQSKKFMDKHNLLSNNKKYYLLMKSKFEEDLNFNSNIDGNIPGLQCVTLACLIVSIYMGFKEIFLLGCEHNWLSFRIPATAPHFYSEDYSNFKVKFSYEEEITDVLKLFKSYRLLKQKFSNVKIYNCTPNSFLDVFNYKIYLDIIDAK